MSRAHRLALLVTAATVAAACGSSAPSPVPASPSSSSSAATSSPAPPTTATPTSASTSASASASQTDLVVFFLHGERLAAVHRPTAAPVGARAAISSLLDGPSASEKPLGVTTTIPQGTRLRSVTVSDGTAVVDLTGSFGSGGGSASMFGRLAELVYTATAVPGVTSVRVWLDGQAASTLGGEGVIIDHPLRRADFAEQAGAILPETPGYGDVVHSPLRIAGTANVFEAVLFVELLRADGTVLAHQRVMASAGTGTRGTFAATLTFSATARTAGTVRAYSLSPRDGSRTNVVDTPVTIEP